MRVGLTAVLVERGTLHTQQARCPFCCIDDTWLTEYLQDWVQQFDD